MVQATDFVLVVPMSTPMTTPAGSPAASTVGGTQTTAFSSRTNTRPQTEMIVSITDHDFSV